MSLSVLPMFSSKSFITSGLAFRSLIHFQFFFVWHQKVFQFHSFTCSWPIFRALLIEEAVFAPLYILASFVKNRYSQVHGFISELYILFHWSTFLFLCQYHTVLMTVALQYNLNLQIAFGSTVIFTILILPTQEHGISLHLFMSSLISFISVL